MNDLASKYPEMVNDMSAKWMTWAKRVLVIPKPEK